METLDVLGNVSYNELYKLHTGHGLYESDSDSNSTASSTYFEENKPPLYSYEEIKAKWGTTESANVQNEPTKFSNTHNATNKSLTTDSLPKQVIKKELENLILKTSCKLCGIIDRSEHDITNHIKGRTHKNVVNGYIKDRLKKLQNKTIVEHTYRSVQSSPSTSSISSEWTTHSLNTFKPVIKKSSKPKKEEKRKEKLNELMLPTYCYICYADLSQPQNALSHYKSFRHKNNVKYYKGVEKSPTEKTEEKLNEFMLPTYCYICYADLSQPDNAFSHYNSLRHKNNVQDWKENSQAEVIQEKLNNLIGFDYCYICSAILPQVAQAESHYNSSRHKNNVDTWTIQEVKNLQSLKIGNAVPKITGQVQHPSQNESNKISTEKLFKTDTPPTQTNGIANIGQNGVDSVCVVCGIDVGTRMQDHYNSDLHKQNVETFCFICNMKTASAGQLIEHIKTTGHVKNFEVQKKDLLKIPEKFVTPVIKKAESLSQKSSTQNAQFNSQRKVEVSQTSQVLSTSVPTRWCYCDICKVTLNGTEKAESHYKEASHIMKDNSFHCHICKIKCSSKMMMNIHVQSFPHNEVSKLKSLVVSKGISTREFWKLSNNASKIFCSLCQVSMPAPSNAADHLRSKRHIDMFKSWCIDQPKDTKDPNTRWYYCDLCKKPLDGTTFVELHYQGKNHADSQKNTAITSQAATTSVSTYQFGLPNSKTKEQIYNVDENQADTLKSVEDLLQKLEKLEIKLSNVKQISIDNESKKLDKKQKGNSEIAKLKNEFAVSSQNSEIDILHCYVCKKQLNSLIELCGHMGSYPHNHIAKLKSLTVSNGIRQEFWIHENLIIWCSLCEVKIESKHSAENHFSSERHVDNFNIWCSLQPKNTKDPNNKWFFCDICNELLDGTSNAIYHYQGRTHTEELKKHAESSHTSATSRASDMNEIDLTTVRSIEAAKTFNKLTTTGKIYSKDQDPNSLQELISLELAKIKNALIYIPPHKVIKFLKKYNKELEDLKEGTKTPIVNVKHVINTKQFGKNENGNNLSLLRSGLGNGDLHLRTRTEPEKSTFNITDWLLLGATGMFLYNF